MIGFVAVVVLTVWGLQRNRRRQLRTTSTNGIPDRDLERLIADLRALA
ncbi:hypothetical protein GCM10029976_053960 [Kribbella albertanoniae]|nr:hypothetical protein [Kribbella albertanoniae]